MAHGALRLADSARTAAVNGVVDLLDAGSGAAVIEVRTGAQPATPATTATGDLLLTFTLNDPAFGDAVNGVASLDVVPDVSATAVAEGTASWFRAMDSSANAVFDGACGTTNHELNLSTLSITVGLVVTVTSGIYTQPME